jgi:hypothetical protein
MAEAGVIACLKLPPHAVPGQIGSETPETLLPSLSRPRGDWIALMERFVPSRLFEYIYKYCAANVSISTAGSSIKHPFQGESWIAFENDCSIADSIISGCSSCRNLSRKSRTNPFNRRTSASGSRFSTRCQSLRTRTSMKSSATITIAMLTNSSLNGWGMYLMSRNSSLCQSVRGSPDLGPTDRVGFRNFVAFVRLAKSHTIIVYVACTLSPIRKGPSG